MKYAILTFYESYNYGTVLQAYALQKALKSIDIETDILHIVRDMYAVNKLKDAPKKYSFTKRVIGKLNAKSSVKKDSMKKARFDDFRKSNLNITSKSYESDLDFEGLNFLYDGFICGSDQIWNPYHKVFSTRYMLDFADEKSKKISFASSFGVSDIKNCDEYSKICELLKRFNAVSVREKSGADIISEMSLPEPSLFLDPVFLLRREEWKSLISEKDMPKKDRYILVYALAEVSDSVHKQIVAYAKKHNCKIKIIPNNYANCQNFFDKPFDSGPIEFLSLIANAECIFTNSFHGAAFSILFNKEVFGFIGDSENARIRGSRIFDLFDTFDISKRVIAGDTEMLSEDKIDFDKVNSIIENNRISAFEYLEHNLNT